MGFLQAAISLQVHSEVKYKREKSRARLESDSKALKPSLLAARSTGTLSHARENKADFIVWKGFIPAHLQIVWTLTGVA